MACVLVPLLMVGLGLNVLSSPFTFQVKRCKKCENDKKSCVLLFFYIIIGYICRGFDNPTYELLEKHSTI